MDAPALSPKDFKGLVPPNWCPGCGDFGVLAALQKAVAGLGIPPHELLIVSGIGCSSNLPGFIKSYGIHSLHGRAIPVAMGAKLANHALRVVVVGGDGDGYGLGVGHFIHAMRRNVDLAYIVMDNQIYGLTTGQASPTSERGARTKTTPAGNPDSPVNPMALAVAGGATFVARGFSGDQPQLSRLFAEAIAHKGFALVDVFSPCVTFNRTNTYDWFRKRLYRLEASGHDPSDRAAALARALEWGDRIPTGLFYRASRPTCIDQESALAAGPLVKRPLGLTEAEGHALLEEMM